MAVITVITPCLLTTGSQRSGAKVALMIKLYKSSIHLVFFFFSRVAASLSAHLPHTIFSVSCVMCELLGCVRGCSCFSACHALYMAWGASSLAVCRRAGTHVTVSFAPGFIHGTCQ